MCNVCFIFEIDVAVKYLSPKSLLYTVGFPFNQAISVSIQIDLGRFCTWQFDPF